MSYFYLFNKFTQGWCGEGGLLGQRRAKNACKAAHGITGSAQRGALPKKGGKYRCREKSVVSCFCPYICLSMVFSEFLRSCLIRISVDLVLPVAGNAMTQSTNSSTHILQTSATNHSQAVETRVLGLVLEELMD